MPRQVEFISALPKSPVGKVLKARVATEAGFLKLKEK